MSEHPSCWSRGMSRVRAFAATLACLASLSATAAEPAPDPGTAFYETRFLEGMIDHHAMAVHMSQTCVQKAVHEALRSLCEQIIAAQQAEISQMQTWLQAWYDVSYQPEMKPGEMHRMHRLMSLSGAEYEMRFLESMIRHHRTAVIEGGHCMERAYHDELVALCENMVAMQSEEIRLMRAWLCEWYGKCGAIDRRSS